jgi:S-formylglutathione hydrolase FrmB
MPSTLLRYRSVSSLLLATTAACSGNGEPTKPELEQDPPGFPNTPGQIIVDSFHSTALGTSKRYLIYLPPSYASTKTRRYPVAYFLHGATQGEQTWVDDIQIERALDSVIRTDSIEMIVVMPDGDISFYHTWVNPPTYESCLERGRIGLEPATTYCVPQMRYDTYIADDLVKHIDEKYRTLRNKKNRGIAGLSMGGAGAVYLTLTRPEVFGAAASMSGGILSLLNVGTPDNPVNATTIDQLRDFHGIFWIDFSMLEQFGTNLNDWRKYDPTTIAAMVPVSAIAPLWFIVGRDDGPSLPGNRTIHNALTQRGVPHTYIETSGGHNFEFWSAHVGEAAGWLARQIRP